VSGAEGEGVPPSKRSPELIAAAEAALDCLGVGPADRVVVVLNDGQREIAESLATAAAARGASVRTAPYPATTRDGEEPPATVATAMAGATVVLAATRFSISHTCARRQATSGGARIATLPGITTSLFTRLLAVDYDRLERAGGEIAARLTAAASCRVTSPAGTDIVLDLGGRFGVCDDGNLQAAGAFGNLPAGEAYIAPLETSADGTIVFDGSLSGRGLLTEPVHVSVRDGCAVAATGDAGGWLLETLDAGGRTGRLIAELGIGTNPNACVTGHILEDEKAIGTAHLAFGTSASFGGANVSNVHIDGLVRAPTIELDGRLLMRDGELLDLPTDSTAGRGA
jgi:leucyl aminopeptidase (aminopeptidase T)